MKKIQLRQIAHARSGDKGDSSNVGVLAHSRGAYEVIKEQLTPERVKAHFRNLVKGKVERFELIWERLSNAGCTFEDTSAEYLGLSSCHGQINPIPDRVNEVVLRVGVSIGAADCLRNGGSKKLHFPRRKGGFYDDPVGAN